MDKIYSNKDADRIRVIQAYLSSEYTRKMAAENLEVSERQITRIVSKYIEDGPESVIHGNTGKPSYFKYPDSFRKRIISLYIEKYGAGGVRLNFKHFKDKLEEEENIYVPYTSLHRILLEAGVQPPETRPRRKVSPPRPRRKYAGELLQADASIHRWLYKDWNNYALHGAIDDATGIITGLWLDKEENMFAYRMVLCQTMQNYGVPKCFYTDNRTVFVSPAKKKGAIYKSRLRSPYFRALLTHLGIDIITTSNPKAKGRIERVWRTLQSRLLNELYLRKITDIKEANAFITGEYLHVFNRAFASEIDPAKNRFRPVPAGYNYNQNLALFKETAVHDGCYIIRHGRYFVLKDHITGSVPDLRASAVLYRFLDDTLHVFADGSWYDLEDIGLVSRRADIDSRGRSRTAAAARKKSPWSQFNPNFLNRDEAEWNEKNWRTPANA